VSHQLWYTSAERGLSAGSRGFCTVKATRGIPQPLAQRLESLSGYTHLFSPHDKGNPGNPVAYHYIQLRQGGRIWYVLSRVCDAGLDYSGRTNKFAHHIVLDRNELPPAGPAWLMSQPGLFDEAWDGVVGVVDGRKPIPRQDCVPRPCARWQEAAGDAGWAGFLAESALDASGPPIHIIVPLQVPLLPLLEEAVALLPPEMRWSATFSTFYSEQFPADVGVRWRVVFEGTREAVRAAGIRHQPVINLTQPGPVPAQLQSPAVEAARRGTWICPPAAAAETSRRPAPAPARLADKEWEAYPAGGPSIAAPPSVAYFASRPPELGHAAPSMIVPMHRPRYSGKSQSVRNAVLIAAFPLMVLGIALGILVQRHVLPELSKASSPSPPGSKDSSSGSGEQKKKTPEDPSTQPSPNAGGGGGSGEENGGSQATGSAGGGENGSTQQDSQHQTGANARQSSGQQEYVNRGASQAQQDGSRQGTESQEPPTDPPTGDLNGQASRQILDATGEPKWHVREISHGLSDRIKLGVIEEIEPVKGGSPNTSAAKENTTKVEENTPFHLLIDGDRLIVLARPQLGNELRMDLAGSQSQGDMPGKFPLSFTLKVPKWVISATAGTATDVKTDVKLIINEIALSIPFTKSGKTTHSTKPAIGSAEYLLAAPWETRCGEEGNKTPLKFKLKAGNNVNGANAGASNSPVDTFKCGAKVKTADDSASATDEKSALTIEIHDPDIPDPDTKGVLVREMKVTRMKGVLVIDIVPEELKGRPIRVVNQEWMYPAGK